MNKSVLITGAFGFVGTNLSKILSTTSEQHLIAVDINATENHFYNEYVSWNDLGRINWKEVNTIIHLAGKAHDTKNTASTQSYFNINVGLTKKIYKHFLQSAAEKFIFFSTVKAVADTIPRGALTEDNPPNPQTAYGKSKLEAENYISNQLLTLEKKVYILRPSMIHGPDNKGNLNLLYKLVSKGIPWPLGDFKNKRSFTSIDNLSFVINQILEKDIEPGVYQIADDEPLSTNRLIELIAETRQKKPWIWNINQKMVYSVAKLGDLLHLPINSERLKKLTESYVVSNIKLKKALCIEKMPVSAEEGMRKTLRSF